MNDHILARLAPVIQDIAGDPGQPIEPTTNIYADFGFDSLAFMELVVAIEERFGLELDLNRLTYETTSSVEHWIGHIAECLPAREIAA